MRQCKCGNQIASNAKSCPQCGHRFTSGIVKVLAWFFGVVVVIAVIGAMAAGPNNGAVPVTSPVAASSPSAPAKPLSPADATGRTQRIRESNRSKALGHGD
jgi:hypothetical protein